MQKGDKVKIISGTDAGMRGVVELVVRNLAYVFFPDIARYYWVSLDEIA